MVVCQHWNLSLVELDNNFTLGEYYCLLALALDQEELERYYWYIGSQGDPKKWKWSSKDKAGTMDYSSTPMAQIMSMAAKMSAKDGVSSVRGTAEEYISATKSPVVYMDNDRNFYTDKEKTMPIEFDFRAKENKNTVVIGIN